MWFQQDGAPAHLSRIVRDHLNLTFPDRWIDRYGPIAWCLGWAPIAHIANWLI